MAKGKWYLKGSEGQKRADQEDAAAKKRREEKSGPWRFRLKNDESAKIIFLDNPEFFFYEHTEKIGKDFITATCLGADDNCPACDSGYNASYVVVCTVLDTRKYEDRDGNVHKIQKKLFVGKSKAREKLLKQMQKRDNKMRFAVYEMSRGSSLNECATGEDFEFLKYVDPKKLAPLVKDEDMTLKELCTPFNYEEILSPKSAKEMRKLFGGSSPVGSDDDKTGESDEDLFDDTETSGGESDDDLFDADEGEKSGEGDLRSELKELIKGKKKEVAKLKALLGWRDDHDLKDDVKIRQSSDPDEVIDDLINAYNEKHGKGSDDDLGGDEDLDTEEKGKKDDDITDIDDII